MRGLKPSLQKNDGLLILDGGTVTALKEIDQDPNKKRYTFYQWAVHYLREEPGILQQVH